MTKNRQVAAKQAKKKHQKELQRKAKKAALHSLHEGLVRPRSSVVTKQEAKAPNDSIGAFARRNNVPFFRAAFETSYPSFGSSGGSSYAWSLPRIASRSDDEILSELRQIGIETNRATFRSETANLRSAIAYAHDAWIPRLSEPPRGARQEFICLAAHELWKRWNEERPSREMAIEALLHVRRCTDDNDARPAVLWGIKFWTFVAPDLTEDIRTFDALDKKLDAGPDAFSLDDLADFAMVASEIVEDEPNFGPQALQVVEGMERQFSEESPEWHYEISESIARIAHAVGQHDRAESMLQDLIAKYPTHGGAYATLAEIWSNTGDEGQRRALALLEQAEALPVTDGHECDLPERIEELVWDLGNKADLGPPCNYAEQPTQRLVRWLKIAFEDVPDEHIEEIGRRGSEAIRPLIHILTDEHHWDPYAPDEGAALRNAFRAIGAIGTREAGQALMDEVISRRSEDELPEVAFFAMRQLTPLDPALPLN